MFNVILKSFSISEFPQTYISNVVASYRKMDEHLGFGGSYSLYSGTFDSYVIKFSLLSFGAFPIFDNLVTPKRLVVEPNGLNFGPRGVFFQIIHKFRVPLSLSVQGHSEVIQCICDRLVSGKRLIAGLNG